MLYTSLSDDACIMNEANALSYTQLAVYLSTILYLFTKIYGVLTFVKSLKRTLIRPKKRELCAPLSLLKIITSLNSLINRHLPSGIRRCLPLTKRSGREDRQNHKLEAALPWCRLHSLARTRRLQGSGRPIA